jgi:AhpD family alkylhydroperoxidase
MKSRMSIKNLEPRVFKAMAESDTQIEAFELDPRLRELIRVRTSQLNGCGYCIDYHAKDARKLGETEQRLYALSAWWETPFFTEEEQALLKLTEEVTHISRHGVSDGVFENAVRIAGERKVAQAIFIAITTNSWNRIAISTHLVAEVD